MMDQKDKERLIELIILGGELKYDTFDYSSGLRNAFAERYGMKELFDRYEQLQSDIHWSEDPVAGKRYERQLEEVRKLIEEQAKATLKEQGIDIDNAIGPQPTEEEKREVILSQLRQMGIDEENAKRLGLDNAEEMRSDGKTLFMYLPDDMMTRDRLDREGVEYERENGKLKVEVAVRLMQGVEVEDNADTREFMKQNKVDFIELTKEEAKAIRGAQKRLFIPNSWQMTGGRSPNSQLISTLGKLAGAAALVALATPAGALIMWVTYRKFFKPIREMLGIDQLEKMKPLFTSAEEKALRKGQTVYSENRGRAVYYYVYQGNLCSINAKDVRLPRVIEGNRLSGADMGKLRRGEMLLLQKENGETFGVRIDVKAGDNIRKYRLANRYDREMTAVPDRYSDKDEKMAYIARKGVRGIDEIFGGMVLDDKRDKLLDKYGMKEMYRQYKELVKANKESVEAEKIDNHIRRMASYAQGKEYIKGMKIK